jgi:hypothetical protein
MGDGIGTGVSGQSANADAQQHNVNATAKNTTATRLRNEEEMEEMEFMAGIISRNRGRRRPRGPHGGSDAITARGDLAISQSSLMRLSISRRLPTASIRSPRTSIAPS